MKAQLVKISAAALSLCMLLAFTPIAQAAEPAIATATTVSPDAQDTMLDRYTVYYSSVLETYSQNGYRDYTGANIQATVTDPSLVGKTELDNASYTGILWQEDIESVSFKVSVKTDALYDLGVVYYPLGTSGSSITRELLIDGVSPFKETESIEFLRFWKDANAPLKDKAGDEVKPFSEENPRFEDTRLFDSDGKYTAALKFYLTAGEHTITLRYIDEPLFLSSLYLAAPQTVASYDEVLSGWKSEGKTGNGTTVVFEAESFDRVAEKTASVIGVEASGDPSASPSTPYYVRMNYIGGAGYKSGNQSITWTFDVADAGYYKLGLRIAQWYNDGLPTYRQIKVDGKVPFAEWDCYSFAYSDNWYSKVIDNVDGEPYLLWLEPGTHTLTMTVKMGPYAEVEEVLSQTTQDMSALIRRIKKVTGEEPDANYDYEIVKNVPGIVEDLEALEKSVEYCEKVAYDLAGKNSSMSNNFDSIAKQLAELIEKPDRIPKRLTDLETALGNLGTWINSLKSNPLGLDKIWIASPDEEIDNYKASIFESIWYGIIKLINSFTKDYQSVSVADTGVVADTEIEVWVGRGTEWCRLIKQLADANFTPKTGIGININVLPSTQITTAGVNSLMLSVAAGTAPDVVLGLGAGMPVEYAARDAIVDLSSLDGYEEVAKGLFSEAFKPMIYNGRTYALPETVNFRCVYYRTDVFAELGLTPPDTWEEFYDTTLPVMYQNGMKCYIPMLYDIFLFQNGGQYYSEDGHSSALGTPEAFNAFKQTCELNINYSIPVAANYFTRFRTGEMPMIIGQASDYLSFTSAAPEINGNWDIAPLPATKTEDGLCRYSSGAPIDCAAILSQSKYIDESWEFLKWWLSDETQTKFANEIENQLGVTARYFSANKQAFSTLSFSKDEMAVINTFFENNVESKAVLGGYYTSRHILNAWTRCVESGDDFRDSWEEAVEDIDIELRRKQQEYGIYDD
ncbi:MAG: extracellular solute-binding protein [Clostridia bacterium]|nr:extracellular solute-binding protein [Clostridia bacterium]